MSDGRYYDGDFLKCAVCAECGKVFYMSFVEHWGYRDGKYANRNPRLFCGYNCMRTFQARKQKKRVGRRPERFMRNLVTGSILSLSEVSRIYGTDGSYLTKIYNKGGVYRKVWVPVK